MSQPPLTPSTTVGDIVRAAPSRSRIFERLGIDYCCGGKKPLTEACRAKGLDVATVFALLSALDDDAAPASLTSPDALGLSALCDHIEGVHHASLREELPRLDFMTRKVAAVHGDHEPRLLEVRQTFEGFATAMLAHTQDEESRVFPAIRNLDTGRRDAASVAALHQALGRLEGEHDEAGAALERLRALTDGYTPPEWACNTFRALYEGLARLESETHQHVHKENNILFPRALATATPDDVLDVRPLPGRTKHATIFQRWSDLDVGGAFVLLNDHDPLPLRAQFEAEFPGEFSWDYLERGPVEFRVRIARLGGPLSA